MTLAHTTITLEIDMHESRRRRAASELRRAQAAERQRPLPVLEQLRRAADRAEDRAARYPTAPVYRDINVPPRRR